MWRRHKNGCGYTLLRCNGSLQRCCLDTRGGGLSVRQCDLGEGLTVRQCDLSEGLIVRQCGLGKGLAVRQCGLGKGLTVRHCNLGQGVTLRWCGGSFSLELFHRCHKRIINTCSLK